MQVFIDTNIYLNYFRSDKEKLASLEILNKLLKNKKLRLIIPNQTLDEYIRRRSSVVEETRNLLLNRKKQLVSSVPVAPFLGKFSEMKKLREEIKESENLYNKLIEKYDNATDNKETASDQLIKKIFSLGKKYKETKKILDAAFVRYLKGNPPKKNNFSYGDAIVWETLLVKATGDSLVIITQDSDFIEKKKGNQVLQTYLQKEWEGKSKKKIELYVSLGEFMNKFEKKEVVKKEVVAEEKQPISQFIPLSQMSLASTVTPVNRVINTQINEEDNSLYIHLADSANVNSSINYCSYCGYKLCNAISSTSRITTTFIGGNDIKFCPNCGNEIHV